MPFSATDLLKKLAFSAGANLLPDESTIRYYVRKLSISVALAAGGGTLCALGVAAGLGGFTAYLIQEGLRASVALPLVGFIALLMASLVLILAKNYLRDFSKITHEEEVPSDVEAARSFIDSVIQSFFTGFNQPPEKTPPTEAKPSKTVGLKLDSHRVRELNISHKTPEDDSDTIH